MVRVLDIASKNALRKQLELLSKKSETANVDALCLLTGAMIDVVMTLNPQTDDKETQGCKCKNEKNEE